MSKSYRFRTQPGEDRTIRLNIEQDFDFIEILSLKLRQDEVYTRFCADYGVVAGRVIVNGGYGVPNASVSIFVPLSTIDENDPIISTLYPYKTIENKNEDGYRYNLLPYIPEYRGHAATGTFPDRSDLLTRPEVLEVYEKYYKYTVRTNESGDFMIVGVPLGNQKIVLDVDLSNIGCFSLRPSDLIRMNMGTDAQFAGPNFRASSDLGSLPQIVNIVEDIEVASFWGEEELCNVGITRLDFDLRDQGIEIQPHCVFMGSMFSTDEKDALLTNCKPKFDTGNLCDLVSAPGRILAVRQTILSDSLGYPVLEQYNLPEGGNVIDEDGTWLIEIPMNYDYVTTNEFGEQILSNDPKVGIPTKGKYRFRIQYQNEGGEDEDVLRADYLVPNIREYGWDSNASANGPSSDSLQNKSYAFSLDWNDYGDTGTTVGQFMINEAINCNDKFFEFNFNRVYTVSSFIDRWKWGYNRSRHLGIKEITDRTCTSTTNRMPVNDGVRNFDLIFFVFNIAITTLGILAYVLIPLLHFAALIWPILKRVLAVVVPILLGILSVFFVVGGILAFPAIALGLLMIGLGIAFGFATVAFVRKVNPLLRGSGEFRGITLPSMSYPDCETCSCDLRKLPLDLEYEVSDGALARTTINGIDIYTRNNSSYLMNTNSNSLWGQTPDSARIQTDDEDLNCSDNNDDGDNTYFQGLIEDKFDFDKANRYTLNSFGIRYSLAGYPVYAVQGCPINSIGFRPGDFYLTRDINYSHRLNWINLRQRYFDTFTTLSYTFPSLSSSQFFQNKITTTIKNGNQISQPFTDNVLILITDPDTLDKLPSGTLMTFTNPDDIKDRNVDGYNVSGLTQNQFGTNSITGTSFTNLQTTVTYIKDNATVGNATVYLTGSTSGRTYNYKGGMEYFQVITGTTLANLNSNSHPLRANTTNYNLMNFGILRSAQRIYYRTSCGTNPTRFTNINSLDAMGVQNWQKHCVLILVRGVDVYTEKQNIEYDLSRLFGFNNGTVKVTGNFFMNVPIQPNTGNPSADWWTNAKSPETHEAPYYLSSIYHKPFNFRPDPQLYSAFTTNSIKYYSSLDRKFRNQAWKVFPNDIYELGLNYSLNIIGFNDNNLQYPDNGVTDVWSGSQQKYRFRYITGPVSQGTFDQLQQMSNETFPQGNVEGGSFMFFKTDQSQNQRFDAGNNGDLISNLIGNGTYQGGVSTVLPRLFAPSYAISNPTLSANITFLNSIDNFKPIIRSDRLPTSDRIRRPSDGNVTLGDSSYPLFQNDNFTIYLIDEDGEVETLTSSPTDVTNNAADFGDDGLTGATSVLSTFSCEGMVPLNCYSGNGENFGVETPCVDNQNPVKVDKGCYLLIQRPYFTFGDGGVSNGIVRDYALFQEWKTRYRFTFAACRGVIGHVFQNNWVNGALYAFSFKRKKVFDVQGNLKKYVFCGSKDFNLAKRRRNQGTIYWDVTKGSFFYRSTPYVITQNGTTVTGGYFIGQEPREQDINGNWNPANDKYKGMNERNLFFPTTIMDLGPKDQFVKEVCLNPQLDNYLAETLKSTSFNDTDDLLLFFILSRILSTTTWGKVFNSGDSSIDNLFSRSEKRIDGDLAQLFSINSEYGILPFDEQFYDDDDIILDNPDGVGNSLIGVLFSASTAQRIALTPGIKTFENNLTQLIGYPKTQSVPMYQWQLKDNNDQVAPTTRIFGSQYNDWKTDLNLINGVNKMYAVPYQSMSFTSARYFKPVNGPATGYIMNYQNGGQRTSEWLPGTNNGSTNFVVGAPYHFYFGLGKGKTALNRFIKKYVVGVTEL